MSLSADLSCLQSGAGADREAAMASLEKELICPICLEIFNKPVVILPCQHNLCRKCANELYQPSLFQARTSMLVSSGRFRCPSCRHEVILDRHGVYGLQRNLLVENIIDVYKQEVCKSAAISLPPPPPLPPPEPAQATCSDHEGEKVNIYCLSCRVPTCSLCKVFGAHQSCPVAPLTQVYQQQKDELREGLDSLAEHRTKIQTVIDELNQMCIDLEEAYRVQKQSVSDQFEHINSILEERRKSMTEVISAEEEEKTGRVKALLRRYGETVSVNSKLLERAQSTMEDPDSVAFVQSSKDVIDKLVGASASCPSETLDPDDENLSHYQYNFSRQYRALLSLDFPREDVPEELESGSETEDSIESEDPEETPAQHTEPPSQTVKDCPVIVPPEPLVLQDGERAELQGDSADRVDRVDRVDIMDMDGTELRHRGAEPVQIRREETPEETHQSPAERPVSAGAVKEEGMTTLQEVTAGSDDSKTKPHPEPEMVERDAGKEAQKSAFDEETETLLYSGWHGHGNWGRDSPINKEKQVNYLDINAGSENIVSKLAQEQIVQKEEACNALEMPCPRLDSKDVTKDDQNMSLQSPSQRKIKQIQPKLESDHEIKGSQEQIVPKEEASNAPGTPSPRLDGQDVKKDDQNVSLQSPNQCEIKQIQPKLELDNEIKDSQDQIVQQEEGSSASEIPCPRLDGQDVTKDDQNMSPQSPNQRKVNLIQPKLELDNEIEDLQEQIVQKEEDSNASEILCPRLDGQDITKDDQNMSLQSPNQREIKQIQPKLESDYEIEDSQDQIVQQEEASNAPEIPSPRLDGQDVKKDDPKMSLQSPNQHEIKQIQPKLESNNEIENSQDQIVQKEEDSNASEILCPRLDGQYITKDDQNMSLQSPNQREIKQIQPKLESDYEIEDSQDQIVQQEEASNAPEIPSPRLDGQDVKNDDPKMSLQSPNQHKIKQIQPKLESNNGIENSQDQIVQEGAALPCPELKLDDKNTSLQFSNQSEIKQIQPKSEPDNEIENTNLEFADNFETSKNANRQISIDEIPSSESDGEELIDGISETEIGGDNCESDKENLTEEVSSDIEDATGSQQEAPQSSGQTSESGFRESLTVQAVTLLFYLLAFLVLLQRFWIYIGRYVLL